MELVSPPPTCADLLCEADGALRAAGVSTPRLDAEVLLALAVGTGRAGLYARLPAAVAAAAAQRFRAAVARRLRREPVAYITGVQEFWSLPFTVTPAVLIPRPETEMLVEVVCDLVAQRSCTAPTSHPPAAPDGPATISVCDVGTGSGCVAVALAHAVPGARVLGIDAFPAALAVARQNAAAHGVAARVSFAAGDLLEALRPDSRFDVLASNPPYVAGSDPLPPELEWEPSAALVAGTDGLEVVRRLIRAAPAHLRDGGWLVMEIGYGQEEAVRSLAAIAGFDSVSIRSDLAGIPRVLVARETRTGPAGGQRRRPPGE